MFDNNDPLMDQFTKLNNELVNARRLLEQQNATLTLEKERYQAISELMSNFAYGIQVKKGNTLQIDWITESCHKLTGYKASELQHTNGVMQIVHHDDVTRVEHALEKLLQDKKSLSVQSRLVAKDHGIHHTISHYQPIIDDKTQQVFRIYVATQDITAEVIMENTRAKLTTEENRVKMLSDFVTLVSHEFFTPLSIIKTSLYLLGKTTPTESQNRHFRKIDDQANNLVELVNSLKTIIELDKERPDLHFQLIELKEMVSGILTRLNSSIKEKNLSVSVELDDDTVIKGDGHYLSMAIGNIIKNAVQYSREDGKIIIRSYHDEYENVIEVEDNGLGIRKADVPFIFERFFRADTSRTVSGSGLGLSIAQVITDHHQGRMDLETIENVGSIFRILLPRRL